MHAVGFQIRPDLVHTGIQSLTVKVLRLSVHGAAREKKNLLFASFKDQLKFFLTWAFKINKSGIFYLH